MPSYSQYKRHMAIFDNEEDITWITVKGNHIPIKNGQNKEEAVKNFFERKKAESKVEKQTQKVEQLRSEERQAREDYSKAAEEYTQMWLKNKSDPELLAKYMIAQNKDRQMEAKIKARKSAEATLKRYKGMLNILDNQEHNLADTGVAKIVNFGKMPLHMAQEAVKTLSGLQAKYPFMKDKLDYVGTQDSEEAHKIYKEQSVIRVMEMYSDTLDRVIEQAPSVVQHYQNLPKEYQENQAYKLAFEQAMEAVLGIEKYGEEEYRKRWFENRAESVVQLGKNTWALYSHNDVSNHGMIVFNSKNYETHGRTSKNYHPVGCDTRKSVLDHEFGHSIWFNLGLHTDKVKANPNGTAKERLKDLVYGYYIGETNKYITENLSQYATVNASEFFAEAFSEWENNPEPRHIAKQVGKLLEEIKKEMK